MRTVAWEPGRVVLLQLFINGIITGLLFALSAAGFSLMQRVAHVFNVAHGALYMVAGYIVYAAVVWGGLAAWLGCVIAVLAAAGLGILVEKTVFAPLARKEASPVVSLISSLGVFTVLTNLVALMFGNDTLFVRAGADPGIEIGLVLLTTAQLVQLAVGIAVLAATATFLRGSPWGRTIRALGDDPQLSAALGMDTAAVRTRVFALGSGLAGVAACLNSLDVGLNPVIGLNAFLIAAVATVVGGAASFEGAVAGGVLLGTLQGLVVWFSSARWVDAVTFGVLVLFLVFRPQGIVAPARRLEEGLT